MTPTRLHSATLVLLAVGALGTLAALVVSADGLSVFRGAGLGFALWALLPYVLLAGALPRFWSGKARTAGLVGTAIVVVGALAVYADALWLHPDAQSGLAFLTVPVVQFAVAALTVALAAVLHRHRAA